MTAMRKLILVPPDRGQIDANCPRSRWVTLLQLLIAGLAPNCP